MGSLQTEVGEILFVKAGILKGSEVTSVAGALFRELYGNRAVQLRHQGCRDSLLSSSNDPWH